MEDGAREKRLYDAGLRAEWVALLQIAVGDSLLTPADAGGEELLVLNGVLAVEDSVCWVKRGRLRDLPRLQ